MNTYANLFLAIIAVVLAGCRSIPTVTPTIPEPQSTPARSSTPPHNETKTWQFRFDKTTHKYQSTTSAILRTQSELNPSLNGYTPDTATISTTTQFTIRIDRTQPTITLISGSLDQVQTIPAPKTHIDNQQLQAGLPLPITGTISSQRLHLDPADLTTNQKFCQTPTSAYLGDIRPMLISLPSRLQMGSTWTDTISTTTCSSLNISSQITTIRTYTVINQLQDTGFQALLIQTKEKTQLRGTGYQGQHPVELTGQGSGSTNFSVNSTTGILSKLHLTQQLTIQIHTSGKSSTFFQLVEQSIKIIN